MSENQVDNGRRRLLIAASGAVGAAAVATVALPFLGSLTPSAKARAAGAPVEVDISKMEPGQQITVEWRGKPVWVLKRTPEMLSNLEKIEPKLADAKCEENKQPEYCRNRHRSIKPELLVVVGICTHLGCSPTKRSEVAPSDLGPDWLGGYTCPCHGSKFDLSGRVFKGVPAPSNLEVPPYQFLSDNTILVGDDGKGA